MVLGMRGGGKAIENLGDLPIHGQPVDVSSRLLGKDLGI